ncbi:MAG: PUA domain-containing protein [Nitrososphaeria archaeon]
MREIKDIPFVIDYIFGRGVHNTLLIDKFKPIFSKRTGKIKQLFYDNFLFGSLRPNGTIALTSYAYSILSKNKVFKKNTVIIREDQIDLVKNSSSVFVKNVKKIEKNVFVGSDVFIVSPKGEFIGIGKAVISYSQIKHFKSGLCIKIRG